MVERKPISDAGEYMMSPNEAHPLYETASSSAEDFAFDDEPIPWEELADAYCLDDEMYARPFDGDVDEIDSPESSDFGFTPAGEWVSSCRPHGDGTELEWEWHLRALPIPEFQESSGGRAISAVNLEQTLKQFLVARSKVDEAEYFIRQAIEELGRYPDDADAYQHALQFVENGAEVIDELEELNLGFRKTLNVEIDRIRESLPNPPSHIHIGSKPERALNARNVCSHRGLSHISSQAF